jgi:mRNA interferase YafQ
MRVIRRTSRFKKDFRKRHLSRHTLQTLKSIVQSLANGSSLSPQHRDHSLMGNYVKFRECHLKSDLLLIYTITNAELILVRIGSHSELFG